MEGEDAVWEDLQLVDVCDALISLGFVLTLEEDGENSARESKACQREQYSTEMLQVLQVEH